MPDPGEPAIDRGLVVRALAGAVAIGLIVGLLGAGVWLAVASRERPASPAPSGVAVAPPSGSGQGSGPDSPAPSAGSPSPSSTPTTSASGGLSPSPADRLEDVTGVGSRAVVSAPVSPFADCMLGGQGTVAANSEVEPTVALDPTRTGTIVAAWQQDRWTNGAAHGLVVATSSDAGATWRRQEPAFSACAPAGGAFPARVSDPWLSFGPSGTAFLSGLSVTQPNESWVTVSRSRDGGRTWSTPIAVTKSDSVKAYNDKESVTADPRRPGRAYLVWDRSGGGETESNQQPGSEGSVMLATTADDGASWTAARAIATLAGTPVGNEVAVLPDGSLVDVFVLAPASQQAAPAETAIRSTDGGVTWSEPQTIATLSGRAVIGSQPPGIRGGGGLPDVALDARSGTIYAAWTDRAHGAPAILLSSSVDGGRTWSTPVPVPRASSSAVFLPSIEVTAAGVIGIEYTDLRAATGAAPLLANRFLTVSTDGGTTWRERRLTETFDIATAPEAGGRFLGDYSGLAAGGETFVSAFAVTTGRAADPTELIVRSDPVADPGSIVP
jgi:BNR repeat-like domain